MVVPAVGDVVLVPFPFSDLSQTKIRPAVCLAAVGRGDWICCQVTSNDYGDPFAEALHATAFSSGGLRVTSFARPGKLFTASSSLFRGTAGRLHAPVLQKIKGTLVNLISGQTHP